MELFRPIVSENLLEMDAVTHHYCVFHRRGMDLTGQSDH